MEMESLFFGCAQNAFYSYDDLTLVRKIEYPLYNKNQYAIFKDPTIKYKSKVNGEIRIIGMDIATQGGSKNDNTCFVLLQMMPLQNNQYVRLIPYIETLNGGHSYDQAIRLRQLYDDFEADYVVIDTNGSGISVFDNLVREQMDNERNLLYSPWTCINDEKMASRCKENNAPKIIYSLKASQQFNSDSAIILRDHLKRGKTKLLIDESDANEILMKSKNYRSLNVEDQTLLQLPYYETTLLINEMVNLSYEVVNGNKIKVSEQPNARKDRFSSLQYANYIANEIEREMIIPKDNQYIQSILFAKAPQVYKNKSIIKK